MLVVKLAALGDVVQAFGPFAAIRAHHGPATRVTLLTTPPYAPLLRRAPWFDEVWDFGRPAWSDPRGLLRLARSLRGGRFDRVYDLQTSARSSRYRALVGRRAEWSGIARGASHPHANPARDAMHTAERQREQLEAAGIAAFPDPDLSWLGGDVSGLGLPEWPFALLVPGASPARPGKRWPHYPALARALPMPVAVAGGPAERPLAAEIAAVLPPGRAVDLTGRTDLVALAAVARRAALAVGNDTGPTHLAAAVGCPTVALFGPDSDPALCAPRGPGGVRVIRRAPLADLSPDEVAASLASLRVPRTDGRWSSRHAPAGSPLAPPSAPP